MPEAAMSAGGTIEVVILRRRQEAEGVLSLELGSPDGAQLPEFEPGAHVDVHVAPGIVRQYSLCGDPARHDRYRLGVLLEPASRGGSAAVHSGFPEGGRIRIGTPRNQFRLIEDAARSVLVGGGIGITPLLAMAHRLRTRGAAFDLHYCTRSRARTAFLDELAEAELRGHVHLHHDDGPAEQRFDPASVLAPSGPGAHLYVCGPAGFMTWVTGAARAQGWTDGQIHLEHFGAEVSAAGAAFEVVARRSGVTLTVPEGRSIADMLLEVGIDVPLSCEQGVCGTCLTPVISGVPDHRDLYQTDEEKAANMQITPCCSRALSARLVLDI
jgi:ferredoxin-NADP reductase